MLNNQQDKEINFENSSYFLIFAQNNCKMEHVNGQVTDIIIDDEVILNGSEDSFDDEAEITDEQVKEIYDTVEVADDESAKYNTPFITTVLLGGVALLIGIVCFIIYYII